MRRIDTDTGTNERRAEICHEQYDWGTRMVTAY